LQLIDVERIRARNFRVLLDANGGAGGPLGLQLLKHLNCLVTPLGCEADGHFAHEPEPIAANLQSVCPRVAENQCDLGCVLDPDSDRLALIDETGRCIGEELTLALAVLRRLDEDKGPVVVNMSTSRLVEDIARMKNCRCVRAAVGEANVTGLMRSERAVIGGEGNGGVIDPRVGFVRDPFIGIGLILELLVRRRQTLSEVVASLPAYTIVKDKYTLPADRLAPLYADLVQRWPETRANRDDGLRLDWPDRWLHVRPSNTEPIVRVIAEAPTAEAAQQLCRDVGTLINA
jgi:phosphomannomutase